MLACGGREERLETEGAMESDDVARIVMTVSDGEGVYFYLEKKGYDTAIVQSKKPEKATLIIKTASNQASLKQAITHLKHLYPSSLPT